MTTETITRVPEADDPVWVALADADRHAKLLQQIMAYLGKHRLDWPLQLRQQEADSIHSKLALRALEKSHTFDRDKGEIGAWLHGIVCNICCEHFRELKKHQHHQLDDNVMVREPKLQPPTIEELQPLIAKLNPADREILEAFHLHGLSHREIASKYHIDECTARQRVRRARIKANAQNGEGER